jgi:hypothetical protein
MNLQIIEVLKFINIFLIHGSDLLFYSIKYLKDSAKNNIKSGDCDSLIPKNMKGFLELI